MQGRGYRGKVLLVSPAGDQQAEVLVPGRYKNYWEKGMKLANTCPNLQGQFRCLSKKQAARLDRNFRRLLSMGWRVVKDTPSQNDNPAGQAGEEEKKNTDLVIGTTKTGNQSHGGDHASGEVKDSPNHARRGSRAGRGARSSRQRSKRNGNKPRKRIKLERAGQHGDTGIYCPQPFRVTPEMRESAEKSAELLAELVGRSQLKTRQGVTVDAERLLVALETGDDPLPPLEAPRERPRLRVLITPDCSGSTQNWSGLGKAWAAHLANLPDTDVIYIENFNGKFWQESEADDSARELVEKADILIYLGDGDGHELCHRYAEMGATVIALDCYCASIAKSRLTETAQKSNGGCLYWVDRVSNDSPDTWYQALRLVLGH